MNALEKAWTSATHYFVRVCCRIGVTGCCGRLGSGRQGWSRSVHHEIRGPIRNPGAQVSTSGTAAHDRAASARVGGAKKADRFCRGRARGAITERPRSQFRRSGEHSSAGMLPLGNPTATAAAAQKSDAEQAPLQLHIGSATLTPVGFMDFTGVKPVHKPGHGHRHEFRQRAV